MRVREPPGYECLHGVAGLGVGHGVYSSLLVDMMATLSLLLPLLLLLLLLALDGALLPAVLQGGRGGGRGGGDVGLGQLQPQALAHTGGLPGLLPLTLRAVGQELGDRLAWDKCVLVRYLQHQSISEEMSRWNWVYSQTFSGESAFV